MASAAPAVDIGRECSSPRIEGFFGWLQAQREVDRLLEESARVALQAREALDGKKAAELDAEQLRSQLKETNGRCVGLLCQYPALQP